MKKNSTPDDLFAAINWELLKNQKLALLELANRVQSLGRDHEANAIDGVVNLIDTIQDIGVENGFVTEAKAYISMEDQYADV